MTDFSPKSPTETEIFTFDFARVLASNETISTASVVSIVKTGTDANPSSMISGVSTITGTKILQKITGGVSGVYYSLQCSAVTSLGQTIMLAFNLSVVSP